MSAFNLPAGVRPGDLPGNRPSDDEAERIFDAFADDVTEALYEIPGMTSRMIEATLDTLVENFGDDIIEKRRIDPGDER